MRKKNYKGRCEKRILPKCKTVFKSYDPIQNAYADILESNPDVVEIQCNVELEGQDSENYTSDFVCVLCNGELMVRECVNRSHLSKPLTMKLLDISLGYWQSRGVKDWGLVIDAAKE